MLRLLGLSDEPDASSGRGVGAHCIADLWGASHLTDAKVLTAALEAASSAAGATLLKIFLHEFPSSGGITGVALLAESHMSIHTWPEKDYAAIDIFMCGRADTRRALDTLILQLKPTHTLVEHFVRGARPRMKNRKASVDDCGRRTKGYVRVAPMSCYEQGVSIDTAALKPNLANLPDPPATAT